MAPQWKHPCFTDKNLGEVLSAQGKEMSEIRSNIAALSTQMAAIMEEVKRNRIDRYRAQSPFEDYAQGWFQIWPDYYVGTNLFYQ
jgi:hypothetical protein